MKKSRIAGFVSSIVMMHVSLLLAEPQIENGVITFNVAEGETETIEQSLAELGETCTKLLKKGKGTLVLTKETSKIQNKTYTVEIQEGVLRMDAYCAIWSYANVYIAQGAQLYANFSKNNEKYSQLVHYFKSIAGSGPDGTGVIRINTVNSSHKWYSCFRNEVTLTGDATIQVDTSSIIGFNTSSKLNLNGNTLTFNGAGKLYFGNLHNDSRLNPKVTAGHIVNNMTGATIYLKEDVLFSGTGENVLTLGESVKEIHVENLVNPIPWKIVSKATENSWISVAGNLRNGVYDPTVNEFAGGFDFNCMRFDINPSGSPSAGHPRSFTFSGTVRTFAVDSKGNIGCLTGYQDETINEFLYVHLKAENECAFNLYTGSWYGYVDGAFGTTQRISLAGNKSSETKPSVARLYLGEDKCSGEYAASVASRVDAWTGSIDTIGTLELHTESDFTINEDFKVAKKNVKIKHIGYGDLIFAGRVSDASVVMENGLATVFAGEIASTVDRIFPSGSTPGVCGFGDGIDCSNRILGAIEEGSVSVFHQTGGMVGLLNDSRPLGRFGIGFYGLVAGTLLIENEATLGAESVYAGETESVMAGKSVFQMEGGKIDVRKKLVMCRGGEADFLMRGGEVVFVKDNEESKPGVYFATDSSGSTNEASHMVFSMTGENALFDASTNGAWVSMSSRPHNMHTSVFNFNAGVFKVCDFSTTHGTDDSKVYFNFNGGELRFSGRDYIFKYGDTPNMITVYENGLKVSADFEDEGGNKRLYFSSRELTGDKAMKIKPLTGKGVAKITLPEGMPRSGYTGIAPVRVVAAEGDVAGWGATASLDFDMEKGTVGKELLITCSGCDYTLPPRVVAYGPDMRTPYECTVELTPEKRIPGPFVKKGEGELVINFGIYPEDITQERDEADFCNTYPGPYIIKSGSLMVPRACDIPSNTVVFVDGGAFVWDWRSRKIAQFGGWGTFFGSRNNSPNKLTVTDKFNVDAEDLAQGRFLALDTQLASDGRKATGDNIVFGDDCVISVANISVLEECKGSLLILRQDAINRLPALETEIEGWRLKLRNRATEIHLVKRSGLTAIVR